MVELVEFGDFVCTRCRQARLPLANVLWSFKSQVQYTYRHFPAPGNPESWLAAVAAEAARRQGQFWPMYQVLFAQRPVNQATLLSIAVNLGLDVDQFLNDLANEQTATLVRADQQLGCQWAIQATPTLLIDGFRFHGGLTQARLSPFIRLHLRRTSKPVFHTVDPQTGLVRWADDGF